MKEWFKKRVTFSNQNLLQELLVSSQVDYNNFMRMKHSTFLELLHMFLYQRLDPIDTCCATSPLTMQTSCATAVLHKKYQNSSDFMQQIVQIVNQHHTRSTSCTTRNVGQHD
jgi:hypothetical protein